MRQVLLGLALGCLLFNVGCDDSTTVAPGVDTTAGVDTSGLDGATDKDTSGSDDTSVDKDGTTADPCDPNPCLNEGACTASSEGVAECACADGWEGDLCDTDTDECAATENPCGPNGTCTNTDGGFDCACNEGWVADENGTCVDVDECADSPCAENEVCTNTDGGYECGCGEGYTAGEGGACADIDECAADESPCDANATCTNTDGGYECACNEGWIAAEDGTCGDVDECADDFSPCGENATCTNTDGAYECACSDGYEGDGMDCSDVDECAPATALNEDFSAVDADGNPTPPEGWTMVGTDMLEIDKEDPVLWHINADGQLQYSNKEGTNYNGSTTGAAALPSMDISAGDMIHASVGIQVGDQDNGYYDQAWIGFLACSTDVDFTGCLTALEEGAVDDNGEAVATLVPLWTKSEYNAAVSEAGLEAGAIIDVSVDLSPAAGWTGWLHFAFDSIDDYGNEGSGFIVDNVSVTQATKVCGANEGCANTDGGYDCTCLEGFQADADGACADIDECAGDVCAANEDCANIDGGYECSCSAGYMANDEGACVDMDECDLGVAECDPNAACENTEGNYNCTCNDGFTGDGKTCTNVDECTEGTDECGEMATCVDGTPGALCQGDGCDDEGCLDAVATYDSWCSFGWDSNCATCAAGGVTPFADCTDIGDACNSAPYTCNCADGYAINDDGLTCSDIDECAGDESPCDANAACTNNEGGYDCACNDGYSGDGATCDDINECETGDYECDVNASCNNMDGAYECLCNNGFSGDGKSCDNVDECADGLDMCGPNAACADAVPGYTCSCNDGYVANDDGMTCSDVDECAANNGGCAQVCTNNDGGYACSCKPGYALGADGLSCDDVDECGNGDNNCDANATCTNNEGGYDCACNDGYSGDGATCDDINECETGDYECDVNASCNNMDGAYECLCNDGFSGDGKSCDNVDECADGLDMCGPNAACADAVPGVQCQQGEWCGDEGCLAAVNDLDPACNAGYWDEYCAACAASGTGWAGLDCSSVGDACVSDVTYSCSCNDGYVANDDGMTCSDVDECANGDNNCDVNATCTNNDGSFSCVCNDGYEGDGVACDEVANEVPCGKDCFSDDGCLTPEGKCIRFTCRAGNTGPDFCSSTFGPAWGEVTYDEWMNGGYCDDVSAKYYSEYGAKTLCAGAPSGCDSPESCAGGDNAWHLWNEKSNSIWYTGKALGGLPNSTCDNWDSDANDTTYTRITACEKVNVGVEINSGQGFGHHGACEGWNGCGDAKTCAQWACNWAGYSNLVSYGKEAPCDSGEFSTCHLFNGPDDLDENWGVSCAVMGVGEIVCSN